MTAPSFAGLELLATAVLALDEALVVRYANPAAESLLETSERMLVGQPFPSLFAGSEPLRARLGEALATHWDYSAQAIEYPRPGREPLALSCLVTRADAGGATRLLVELRPIAEQLRLAREERLLSEQQANRELIRNLAHEIRNPLGGLRGSAQLLERELERPQLKEYTQVIIQEADRLQALLDRLLTPHRTPRMAPINVHEVLERVCSLLAAEFPRGVTLRRDYDPSVPEMVADKEQLIQVVLNVARNAAQALTSQAGLARGGGSITFQTRVLRHATIARRHHKLALELQVIDDGPGIAEDMRERIFHPLVSGREGGSGLGLSLAQSYVQYHHGVIECDSRPGHTVFRVLLPLS